MPDPIETMKGERERQARLDRHLGQKWPGPEGRGNRRRFHVPTEQRGDEIGGAEDVEDAANHRAGDAVGDGEGPCHLGFVDREMRGDGPVAALGYQDGGAGVSLGRLGFCVGDAGGC